MILELTPRLRRITAPNPGPMTGEGTNTYLIGTEKIAVIDPGPAIDSHIEEILAAVDGRLEWIIVTHTHRDHSPAAQALAKHTGAPLYGCLASELQLQDTSFKPDVSLQHDKLIESGEFTLRAIHTPGHVDNHYCFLLEDDHILMAGDHLMNGSTVVIVPPQGDMKAYIQSLERLQRYPINAIAPGHGELIEEPAELIEWTIAHRLQREQKVLRCLAEFNQGATTAELVSTVYDDVDQSLHGFAEYSLLAHLIKLLADGKVANNKSNDSTVWQCLRA